MVSYHSQFSSESQSCLQLSLRWSARRLSLRDDPEGHFKENCTILFYKLRHSQDIFCLFVFWKPLICGVLCVDMQGVFFSLKISLIFTTKTYQEFIRNRTQLSLDLNQPKYECWCEFEKDPKVFPYGCSETIPIFFNRLSANIVNFYIQKMQ